MTLLFPLLRPINFINRERNRIAIYLSIYLLVIARTTHVGYEGFFGIHGFPRTRERERERKRVCVYVIFLLDRIRIRRPGACVLSPMRRPRAFSCVEGARWNWVNTGWKRARPTSQTSRELDTPGRHGTLEFDRMARAFPSLKKKKEKKKKKKKQKLILPIENRSYRAMVKRLPS